jgi:CxxC motif-containing protein (DUF1111 family)
MKILIIVLLSVSITLASCDKIFPEEAEISNVLEGPISDLSETEKNQFLQGDKAFGEIYTSETGLGPIYVENSCVSCHVGGGKSHLNSIVTRFGQFDETGNHFLEFGGPQLQNKSLTGYQPEKIPTGVSITKLIAPIVVGLGYLDFVTDADIIAMSDPDDIDGDGVSGVPNWNAIPVFVDKRQNSIEKNGKFICRFGKKASVYDIKQQIVQALNEDLGINSIYDTKDLHTQKEIDPEISSININAMNFYLRTLKAPSRRNQTDPEVIKGNEIFNNIQCSSCHRPTLKTGYSPINSLSYKEFHPFTDLLLHDMGPKLDDGYTEGSAKTAEWRTPPLWGLGLAKASQGGNYFLLHDGRARSIEEAILMHGGEALSKKVSYLNLNETDKKALIKFLESL